MACLATATVYTTNSVNNLVYSSDSADAAAAAGYILLSMINIIWLFYFGSTDDSTPKAWVDGFSVNKYKNTSSRGTGQPLAPRGNTAPRTSDFEMHENPFSGNQNPYGGDRPVSVTSAANMGPPVGAGMDLSLGAREPELGTDTMATTGTTDTAGLPIQYSYRARALFAYEANPEDENEISFDKDEILEVSDIQGRWWQARRANGEVGICPSNYVELLQ